MLFYVKALYDVGNLKPHFSEKEIENLPKLVMFKMSCTSYPFEAMIGPSKVEPACNPS